MASAPPEAAPGAGGEWGAAGSVAGPFASLLVPLDTEEAGTDPGKSPTPSLTRPSRTGKGWHSASRLLPLSWAETFFRVRL